VENNQFFKTGFDKELPYIQVLMEKNDTAVYPRYGLPEGYAFRFYEAGMEEEFARLQCLIGGTESIEAVREIFVREFSGEIETLKERMVYVIAPDGACAGTICLWRGDHLGEIRPRVHWVTVHPAHQNKGIAKAMLTRLFDLHNELGLGPSIYLVSQTWSYKAINIYFEFGFNPYICEEKECFDSCDFRNQNSLAWNLIFDKIELYETEKEKRRGNGR
jgi:GNAT superfamily N-acetyltransferase